MNKKISVVCLLLSLSFGVVVALPSFSRSPVVAEAGVTDITLDPDILPVDSPPNSELDGAVKYKDYYSPWTDSESVLDSYSYVRDGASYGKYTFEYSLPFANMRLRNSTDTAYYVLRLAKFRMYLPVEDQLLHKPNAFKVTHYAFNPDNPTNKSYGTSQQFHFNKINSDQGKLENSGLNFGPYWFYFPTESLSGDNFLDFGKTGLTSTLSSLYIKIEYIFEEAQAFDSDLEVQRLYFDNSPAYFVGTSYINYLNEYLNFHYYRIGQLEAVLPPGSGVDPDPTITQMNGIFTAMFAGMGAILGVQILPGITIGGIVIMILTITLVPFLIGLFKGGGK